MGELLIREATDDDVDAIDAIYNHYVLGSTCTWQYRPEPREERLRWLRAHGGDHPVIVATLDGEVVGFGSLSRFREREGYRRTVENTVYVHADHQRRGVGRRLLDELLERARRVGHHMVIAGVSADQEASIALHRAAGFVEVGRMREVGFKFGRWLDLVFLQRMLD
jgi:phosphinothricin acetyltransferase